MTTNCANTVCVEPEVLGEVSFICERQLHAGSVHRLVFYRDSSSGTVAIGVVKCSNSQNCFLYLRVGDRCLDLLHKLTTVTLCCQTVFLDEVLSV